MIALIDTCPNCKRALKDGRISCNGCASLPARPIPIGIAIETLKRIAAEQTRALNDACHIDDTGGKAGKP